MQIKIKLYDLDYELIVKYFGCANLKNKTSISSRFKFLVQIYFTFYFNVSWAFTWKTPFC